MKKQVLLIVLFFVCGMFVSRCTKAEASDYIITNYGQGVFSIEHDGIIHIQGKGEPGKAEEEEYRSPFWDSDKSEEEPETEYQQDLEWARKYESQESWSLAAEHYEYAGKTEKMKEMAYEAIEEGLDCNEPPYSWAADVAVRFLKDKDLAMGYFEKHTDQQLAKEEK